MLSEVKARKSRLACSTDFSMGRGRYFTGKYGFTREGDCLGAKLRPGNEDSAGKRRRRRITPGNRCLKRTLVQTARAANHTKGTYLASQYRRLAGRRGKKRAPIAVGHSMLVVFYHMLKDGTSYTDLGGHFFDRLEPERLTRYYVRRLECLGYKVKLETCVAA
jgi:hypothetical protein